jgi:uncharacterized protein (TIGR02246 family)
VLLDSKPSLEERKMSKKNIEDVIKGMSKAYNRGDIRAVVEFYTDDAKFLHPNTEMISGKQAIKEFFKTSRAFGLRSMHFDNVEIGNDGNLAYERGVIHMYFEPEGGQAMMDKGKYLVVMKRQPDGSWKVAVDIWNSDLPEPIPK